MFMTEKEASQQEAPLTPYGFKGPTLISLFLIWKCDKLVGES
jgi:hypothetical protein